MELKPHAAGDFSMAVVQANSKLEDQSQVFTSPSETYIGVYDGHGGSEASRFVNRYLFTYIRKFAMELGGLSPDAIKKAFNATEDDFAGLVKRSLPMKTQIAFVGSCCLVGIISKGELHIANLGDSRAVLGTRASVQGKNSVVAERLTIDHNVSDENVRKEVEELHPDDSHVVVNCRGVWRIKGIIQVSRSIGDLYLKKPEVYGDPNFLQYGNYIPMKRPLLTAEPSIMTRKLKPQDLFVIFASDGLWEHLSDETAVEIVSKSPRFGIAKRLVAAALQAACKKKEIRYKDFKKIGKGTRRHFHDDITVIVVYLGQQNPSHINKNTGAFGCFMSPIDIYSYNSDEVVDKVSWLVHKFWPSLTAVIVQSSAKRLLHFLFGKNFERATRIVDQRGVKRISGVPSGRSIFQVVGESRRKEEYLCYAEHYCACYSFFYDVVNRGEQLCCKHQLAARLAATTEACVDFEVSDVDLAFLLSKA
ncbi:Phosphatase 2C family protein [Dorcoceras hygrometricum]|uniref:protein-serine/threonine phosphatase n=1 Tax=Dorcoceras hygrometricum TaxID=472368 RepID=A0A2Z7C9R1_9LAMI|nr:Phosphatase 2C family protein [Dorcoceras hygrometricum]